MSACSRDCDVLRWQLGVMSGGALSIMMAAEINSEQSGMTRSAVVLLFARQVGCRVALGALKIRQDPPSPFARRILAAIGDASAYSLHWKAADSLVFQAKWR